MAFLYQGAIHIHSVYSDGTGTVEEIASAAKKAGLKWIIIDDHNNIEAKEGIYEGVCVIVGLEITPEDENHYLALDVKNVISPELSPEKFIQEVKNQGGFGFIAHPDGKITRKNSYRCLRWQDWSIKDFGGLEIWNYMSNWMDGYNEKNPFKVAFSYIFRNHVLSGPISKILHWWDELNNESQQIIPAIGGLDAHAFDIKKFFMNVKIFPYENMFKSITNIIFLEKQMPDDFELQKKVILGAIKSGNNMIVNTAWTRKRRKKQTPVFYVETKNTKVYPGATSELNSDSKIIVKLPLRAKIKIIHNGKILLEETTKQLEVTGLDEGKYRLEAYYKNRPWIFSNPILVK